MRYSRLGVPLAVTIGLIGLAACDSSTGLDGRQRMQKSQPLAFRVKTGPEPGLPTPDFDGAAHPAAVAALQRIAQSDVGRMMDERHRSVAARGPLAFVFPERPLPENVLAVVRLGAERSLPRYAVLATGRATNSTLSRVVGVAFMYEMRNPTDQGPVTLTLFSDGRLESVSASRGRDIGTHVPERESSHAGDSDSDVQELMARAQESTAIEIPGFGRARVARIDHR
jgi:hypothetical protein